LFVPNSGAICGNQFFPSFSSKDQNYQIQSHSRWILEEFDLIQTIQHIIPCFNVVVVRFVRRQRLKKQLPPSSPRKLKFIGHVKILTTKVQTFLSISHVDMPSYDNTSQHLRKGRLQYQLIHITHIFSLLLHVHVEQNPSLSSLTKRTNDYKVAGYSIFT
jgi:hypothetical protein